MRKKVCFLKKLDLKKTSGSPSQNSRPHDGYGMYGHPPKNRLRIFIVQILEYFDSKSITREIVRTPASKHPRFLASNFEIFLRSDFPCILGAK